MNLVLDPPRASSALASGTTPPTDPRVIATHGLGDQVTFSGGEIPPGTTLYPGQWVASADQAYVLTLQTDGNLVLYQVIGAPPVANGNITASALWATASDTGARFAIQNDGNLVLYDDGGKPIWFTDTQGVAIASLTVQTDGNLVLYATDGSAPWASYTNHLQVWPPPRWVNIQSNLVAPVNGSPYVLTANTDGSVSLDALVPGSAAQLWQTTPDGRLLSGLLGGWVLGQAPGTSTATASRQSLPSVGPQIWYWSNALGPASLLNRDSGQYLYADTANGPVTVQDCDAPAQWYFVPTTPLDAIMSLPPANPAFPAFPDDQQAVYDSINTQLATKNHQPGLVLRDQYPNLAATLDTYRDDLPGLDYSAFDPSVWQPVVEQLQWELAAAIGVRNLFDCYGQFHSDLFDDKGALLSQLGQDAGFEDGDTTNVGGIILAVLSGVIYTVLSAETFEGDGVNPFGVAANVIQSGINVGQAAQKTPLSPSLFQVAYADLWGQLSSTFEALLATFNEMEQTILTDWTKLQTAYTLIASTAPDGLAWQAGSETDMVTAGRQGYVLSVMQMLLPAKYQIYQYTDDNNDPIDDVPSYAQYVAPDGNGGYYKYWIADATDWGVYPDESALDQVWNNGGSPDEFWNGKNGWAFPKSIPYTFDGNDANYLVVTLTNLSPNPLVVETKLEYGLNFAPAQNRLDPYETMLIRGAGIALPPGGVGLQVNLYDPSRGAQAGTAVASFEACENWSELEAGDVFVQAVSASGNYQLSTPICNEGGFYKYPGAVGAVIYGA